MKAFLFALICLVVLSTKVYAGSTCSSEWTDVDITHTNTCPGIYPCSNGGCSKISYCYRECVFTLLCITCSCKMVEKTGSAQYVEYYCSIDGDVTENCTCIFDRNQQKSRPITISWKYKDAECKYGGEKKLNQNITLVNTRDSWSVHTMLVPKAIDMEKALSSALTQMQEEGLSQEAIDYNIDSLTNFMYTRAAGMSFETSLDIGVDPQGKYIARVGMPVFGPSGIEQSYSSSSISQTAEPIFGCNVSVRKLPNIPVELGGEVEAANDVLDRVERAIFSSDNLACLVDNLSRIDCSYTVGGDGVYVQWPGTGSIKNKYFISNNLDSVKKELLSCDGLVQDSILYFKK